MAFCFNCLKTVPISGVAVLCKPIVTEIPTGVCSDDDCSLCHNCLRNTNPELLCNRLPRHYIMLLASSSSSSSSFSKGLQSVGSAHRDIACLYWCPYFH